jgi:hypothetical protein
MLRRVTNRIQRIVLRFRILRLAVLNRVSLSPLTAPVGPVVSLTTYGPRANTVYLAIESIGRGSTRPSRLILWIDDETFLRRLPPEIQRQKRRGLEVRSCEDLGPHKKYFPFLQEEEHFDKPLVTADDDMMYPRNWLEGLVKAFGDYPSNVNCYRARVMSLKSRGIAPYKEWELCESSRPSLTHVATGCSGVIYPPSLLPELKRAGSGFKDCCPNADDLWLHVQAIRAGYKIRQVHEIPVHFSMLPATQQNSLYVQNVVYADGNDRQIRATYKDSDIMILAAEDSSLPYRDEQDDASDVSLDLKQSVRSAR